LAFILFSSFIEELYNIRYRGGLALKNCSSQKENLTGLIVLWLTFA
jgi:hypothetical protein